MVGMWFTNKAHVKPWHSNIVEDPKMLSEHLVHRMHYDRNPLLITLEDKYKSRQYVSENSSCKLAELYHFLEPPNSKIPWDRLPERCVLKSNHWSGDSIFILDGSEKPIENIRREHKIRPFKQHGYHVIRGKRDQYGRFWPNWRIQGKFNRLMKKDYPTPFEWGAYNIQPRGIMVEELLIGEDGGTATDLKMHCFGGEVGYIQYEPGRFSSIKQNIHLPNGDLIDTLGDQTQWLNAEGVTNIREHLGDKLIDECIGYAEDLSKEIDYTRVDLFLTDKGVRYGEFTNYPRSGQPQAQGWEEIGGALWCKANEKKALKDKKQL